MCKSFDAVKGEEGDDRVGVASVERLDWNGV